MSSSIRMICPSLACRALLAVPAATRGKTVRCSQCGLRVSVPAKPAAAEPAAASDNTAKG